MSKTADIVSAAFVLTPAAGKRVIGKAVASLPEVKRAAEHGRLLIANGTTTSYIIEALTGQPIDRFGYCVGVVTEGKYVENSAAEKSLFYCDGGDGDGEVRRQPFKRLPFKDFLETLRLFEPNDVFIKGANAVDPYGFAGGLQTNPNGGSWAEAYGVCTARGFHTIVPVGLEKMIPSVVEASKKFGQQRVDYCVGNAAGLIPLCSFNVITEIQALGQLTGVQAVCVAAGGIGGSEGARGFVVEGTEEQVQAALALALEFGNEQAVAAGPVKWSSRLPEGL
jgi:hypothetical protein